MLRCYDLGHGPFSHSFEKIFNTDHEAFTQAIITGNTEVNGVLSRVSDNFPKQVADVINKTHDNKLVISMISSQLMLIEWTIYKEMHILQA